MYRKDLTGKKNGKITILSYSHMGGKMHKESYWSYKCDCGKIGVVLGTNFSKGRQQSCGCGHKKKFYDMGHPLYSVWRSMRARCRNPKLPCYNNYGGKGVAICKEWDDYQVFYDWAINSGYKKGLCLDKDINGNGLLYSPKSCVWVTHAKNNQAKKGNKLNMQKVLEIRGSNLSAKELSVKYDVSYSIIYSVKNNRIWKIQ